PLPGRRNPGRSNLHAPVRAIYVHEPRTPDCPARTALHRGENYRLSPILLSECLIDELTKVLPSPQQIRNPSEDVFHIVPGHVPKQLFVLAPNRLKPNDRAFQSDRRFNLQPGESHAHRVVLRVTWCAWWFMIFVSIILHLVPISRISS